MEMLQFTELQRRLIVLLTILSNHCGYLTPKERARRGTLSSYKEMEMLVNFYLFFDLLT